MSPPDTSLRERLRRLGASGAGGQRAHPATPVREAGTASGAGDGIEVLSARFAPAHRHGRWALGECIDAVAGDREGVDPSHTVWLDTETTGLAGGTGTYVFLVGLGSVSGAGFVIEQFLLRRLSAEGRFLSMLQARLAGARRLVTFNGQRFDWPLLEARWILTRLRPAPVDLHTDLIHPARRLWHRVLGTHRLSAIEAEVLGAPRPDDIPGWMIPQVYVQYLRTSDRAALEPILAHNRADLLALLGLHAQVARVLGDPHQAGPIDWEGAGVLLARRAEHRQAAACFERSLRAPLEDRDRWRVLRRCVAEHRALGDGRRVGMLWEEAVRDHPWGDGHRPRILAEVAKVRERAGDLAGAHAAAEEALSAATALHARGTLHPPHLMDRLTRKVDRLGRLLQPHS